ncbi:nitroreductase family protein [Hymenobacter taeanensis]|uniref:Nitroreductase family protein n=1 Tax=Hymenobacter taeanensis TaxID=2735321 RepID=A0A6M6BHT4_9BACT|nr:MULTISPECIES: nitroreductase family protein [Hymenobacter]QJX47354.1 nitroreductase family protein [Hymenobacter taeanensis]UOQ79307.1 nitroreductase family protein [Hymenobacter sp. 5414T-23]
MKDATTVYPVQENIRKRWSPRSFANKPVDQEILNQVFEAASWAASAMNEQPWRYIYAHRSDEETFQKLVDCLLPGNQPWAKNAPVLILSLAKTHYDNGTPNGAALHDVGMANANLITEATALDLYGHFMGGFDRAKTTEVFQLPEGLQPVVIIALGYMGEAELLEEPFLSREKAPRARKHHADIAFNQHLPA